MQEFLTEYNRDFKTTGGAEHLMDSFCGLQYVQTERGITIHQDAYIQELLRDYEACATEPFRPKRLPMRPEVDLQEEEVDQSLTKQSEYRSWVQRIAYAAHWTRPDIAYAVGELARFGGRAGTTHFDALRHLLCYLKYRQSFRIHYPRGKHGVDPLSGFADANWKAPKSTTGTLSLFNGAPLEWRSKRQNVSAMSTAEAEFMSVSALALEMIYLRRLCAALGLAMRPPTPVGEDNSACMEWTKYYNMLLGGGSGLVTLSFACTVRTRLCKRGRSPFTRCSRRSNWLTSSPSSSRSRR